MLPTDAIFKYLNRNVVDLQPYPKGEPLAPRLVPARPDPFFSFLPPFCPVTFKDPTDVPARQLFACHSFIVFVNNSLCLFACHSFIVCKQLIRFTNIICNM